MRALGVARTAARQLFLSQTLRNFLFAAVRIGVAGTHHAQRLQWELTRVLDDVLRTCAELREDEIAQTAPLADLVGSMHDRLYSRLFQS